jgi:hypothetical protein
MSAATSRRLVIASWCSSRALRRSCYPSEHRFFSTVHPATSEFKARARDYMRLDELVAELTYENWHDETPPGAGHLDNRQ